MGQLCFWPAPEPPAIRRSGTTYLLFYGAMVEGDLIDQAHDVREAVWPQRRLRGSLRPLDMLHGTIRPVGIFDREPPPSVIDRLQTIGRDLAAQPFEARLDYVGAFGGGRGRARSIALACSAPVPAFTAQAKALGDVLDEDGFPFRRYPAGASPHVTLGHDHAVIPKIRLQRPLVWRPRCLSLILSHQGETRYDHLGDWPFVEA